MPWGLRGLGAATSALSAMIGSNRLPHALLFTGPKGGGKNTLARALAAAVNCASPDSDGSPCGHCLSCQKIARDIHPDLKTLAPEGAANIIKMESVQALRAEMAFRPFEGRVKVFIVREADRLTSDSGNALLKTLEEPPPDSILILTSASEAEVMATILSRCLRLKLPPLDRQTILAALADERGLTGPSANLLACLSAGALGPALELNPDDLWNRWQELQGILGAATGPERLAQAWAWVKKTAENKEDFRLALNILRLWWRETARLSAGGVEALEGPPPQEAQFLWAARLKPSALAEINRASARLEDSLARFVKPELAFENYWLSVLAL